MKAAKQSWFLAGGFLSAVAASLCCIGPLVAVAAGASTFATAGWFDHWRPAFLAVTGALMVAAWGLAIRARRVACSDASCPAPRAGTWTILAISTLLAGAAAAFPRLASAVADGMTTPVIGTADGTVFRVRIPSMDCAACAVGIQGTLKRVAGVKSAVVRYEKKDAEIIFDPAKISAEAIIAKIDATGFKAERLY